MKIKAVSSLGKVNTHTVTHAGGVHVYPAELCEIRFRDSGPGIDAETLGRIFEPFFTTKPEGTGLGVAIIRKIIESHGGTLEVESDVGIGTTVIVRLPLQIEPNGRVS